MPKWLFNTEVTILRSDVKGHHCCWPEPLCYNQKPSKKLSRELSLSNQCHNTSWLQLAKQKHFCLLLCDEVQARVGQKVVWHSNPQMPQGATCLLKSEDWGHCITRFQRGPALAQNERKHCSYTVCTSRATPSFQLFSYFWHLSGNGDTDLYPPYMAKIHLQSSKIFFLNT